MACPSNSHSHSPSAVVNRSPFTQYITQINGHTLDAPIALQPGEELPIVSALFQTTQVGPFEYRLEWWEE